MGLITAVTDWGKGVAQNSFTTATTRYSYKTISYLFEQISAIPRFIHTLVTHPPSRAIPAHLLRITVEDLVPLVLLPYSSDVLLRKARELLESVPESEDWLSATTAIEAVILLLRAVTLITWIYSFRAKIEFLVRTLAVSLEAPIVFNNENPSAAMTVCKDEGCTQLRFLKGAVRDLVAYEATEALIYSIRLLSPLLANSLLIFHRGDYLLTLALPNLCNRHQVAYLWRHSDLALSLGLGHMISSWLLNSFVERTSGIPSTYYYRQLDLFALIIHIGIATHLTLPQPAKNISTQGSPDPIAYYQKGVGVIFDVLMQKLKGYAPQFINIRQYQRLNAAFLNPSWSKFSVAGTVSWHVLAYIFLPPMLQNTHSFINDPIIRTNWPTLQKAIIHALKEAIAAKTNVAVKTLSFFPATTGVVAWFTLGIPSALTKLVLQLITNDDFINQLNRWQVQIERLNLNNIEPIVPVRNDDVPLLRGQMRVATPVLGEPKQVIDTTIELPAPDQVIKLRKKVKTKNPLPRETGWEIINNNPPAKVETTKETNTLAAENIDVHAPIPTPNREWVLVEPKPGFFKLAKDSQSWAVLDAKSAAKLG